MSEQKIKRCKKCGTERFVGDTCKICDAERKKLHRENNPERYRELGNKWKRENPESVKTTNQNYYAENRERILEKDRRWRAANVEKNRARQREYNRLKPWQDKAAANCNARALEKGVPRGMKGADLLNPNTGELPEFCPIFPHIRLDYKQGADRRCWASVDRKVPELGYTSGNVWVISMAANTWKSNGSNSAERVAIIKLMSPKKPSQKLSDGQITLF